MPRALEFAHGESCSPQVSRSVRLRRVCSHRRRGLLRYLSAPNPGDPLDGKRDRSPSQYQARRDPQLQRLHARSGRSSHRRSYTTLGIAATSPTTSNRKVLQGLACDVLILSGGRLGGQERPRPQNTRKAGRPLHLSRSRLQNGQASLVRHARSRHRLRIPGNPVSVLACFEVFIRSAIRQRQAAPEPRPIPWWIPLAERFDYSTRRQNYHPARIEQASTGPVVRPLSWKGSPDLRALAGANALLMIPAGDGPYEAGTRMGVLLSRTSPASRPRNRDRSPLRSSPGR